MDPGPDFVPPPPPGAGVSITDPISKAIEHTRRMLFPFDAGKWFTLGFVAFLAHLGEQGASVPQLPDLGGRRGSGSGSGLDPVLTWVADNLVVVVTVSVLVLVLGTAIGVALLWVSSRSKLMFVDCIVHDRAAVEEPWRRWRERGRDLFWVRLWLGVIGFVGFAIAAGLGVLLALPDLRAGRFGQPALVGVLVGVAVLLVTAVPLGIASVLLEDFVVPAMFLNDEPAGPAWRRVRAEILRDNLGTVIGYFLMKVALGVAVGLLAAVATCLTCCIAALPYLGTVILLPLFVFLRAYTLFFVQQFGPAWQLFPRDAAPW